MSSIPAATLAAAVSANNAFTVDLYQQAVAAPDVAPTNVVMSPFSASIALTMTYAGAMGATATQMASTLHLGGTPSIFDGQNALLQALAGRAATARAAGGSTDTCASDYQLQVVSSVWGQNLPWESSFLDVLAQSYGTGVYQTSFESPGEDAINSWVSCETNGKVTHLLPPMSTSSCTVMVLVNALHLKLPWQNPFPTSATTVSPFTTGAGAVVMPSFMNLTAYYPYVDDGKAQVVAVPLMGDQLSVVITMPHGDLATYEAALTAGSAALSSPSGLTNVALSLPKFKLAPPSFSLATALTALGMTDAFNPTVADFTGLVNPEPTMPACCPPHIAIADVLHEATFAVQESGVEAAAATAVVLSVEASSSGGPPPPIQMTVNKPFLFSVVDATGAVLFVGHVQDPTMAPQASSYHAPGGGC